MNPRFTITNKMTADLTSTLCLYRAGYDFKRLFSISEYYDRDRARFYSAIQGVRDNGMDMSGWLEYFIGGLATQLAEARERGEKIIRRDALALKHGLSARQTAILGLIGRQGRLTINDILHHEPDLKRRSVQRDLKVLLDLGILTTYGATNNLEYGTPDMP